VLRSAVSTRKRDRPIKMLIPIDRARATGREAAAIATAHLHAISPQTSTNVTLCYTRPICPSPSLSPSLSLSLFLSLCLSLRHSPSRIVRLIPAALSPIDANETANARVGYRLTLSQTESKFFRWSGGRLERGAERGGGGESLDDKDDNDRSETNLRCGAAWIGSINLDYN